MLDWATSSLCGGLLRKGYCIFQGSFLPQAVASHGVVWHATLPQAALRAHCLSCSRVMAGHQLVQTTHLMTPRPMLCGLLPVCWVTCARAPDQAPGLGLFSPNTALVGGAVTLRWLIN